MLTSIAILDSGAYEVSAYFRDGLGYGRWRALRSFWSQGDAREFAGWDAGRFTAAELEGLARSYDGRPRVRDGFKRYKLPW